MADRPEEERLLAESGAAARPWLVSGGPVATIADPRSIRSVHSARSSGAQRAAAPTGLREQLVAAGRSCADWQRRVAHLASALDRSGEWAFDGARTCAHWIAGVLDVEVCTAREWVRIGRALEELPVIDAAFAAARLSYSKVRALTRVASPENEAELCGLAERTPAGRLSCALAAWLARREMPEQAERRQHEARSLSRRLEPDGMVVGNFRLPPLAASALMVAVDARVLRNRRPAPGSAEGGADASADAWMPRSAATWPSVAQQWADALVDIVRDSGNDGRGGGVATEVVLHVRGDGCTLDDGTPIAGSATRGTRTRAAQPGDSLAPAREVTWWSSTTASR
ncbi:MAG: hypothetical protein U0V73_13670 [Acidimicrobiia bacterium]